MDSPSVAETIRDDEWLSWMITFLIGIATIYIIASQGLRKRFGSDEWRTGKPAEDIRFHVLIPCHVDSDRRTVLFWRCLRSLSMQVYDDRFDVLISLSGSAHHREKATEFIKMAEARTAKKIVWHLHDTQKTALSQMEHLRLLSQKSAERDPNARLLFLNNNDMFHPMRLKAFREALLNLPLPPEAPFPLSCKLLLSETIGPDEGQMTDLIKHPADYFLWQKNSSLRQKMQWVPTSRSDELEFIDYLVPSHILVKFFLLTPVAITSHRFCDRRFRAILGRLCRLQMRDLPQYPWLLAHYSKPSMDTAKPSAKDVALSKRFKKLFPGQIAIYRGHLESLVIQCIGWDDKMLVDLQRVTIKELNSLHGPGLADDLWEEVVAELTSLFQDDEINSNRGAWQSMVDD